MRVTTSRKIHLFLREKENEINEILHKNESPKSCTRESSSNQQQPFRK